MTRMDIGQLNLKMMQPLYGYRKRFQREKPRPETFPSHPERPIIIPHQLQKQNPTSWSLPAASIRTNSFFIGFWDTNWKGTFIKKEIQFNDIGFFKLFSH